MLIYSPNKTRNKGADKRYRDNWDRIYSNNKKKVKFSYTGTIIFRNCQGTFALEDSNKNVLDNLKINKKYKITIQELE